jgi:triphosphoribosyl-dephospho-CoA synthase
MSPPWTSVAIYLAFLSKFPDTHIVRKFGPEAANSLRTETAAVLERFEAETNPEDSFAYLLAFDTRLKAQGFNPGTSADLTVATLFADRLSSILLQPRING